MTERRDGTTMAIGALTCWGLSLFAMICVVRPENWTGA
jgi:hypothetical protein